MRMDIYMLIHVRRIHSDYPKKMIVDQKIDALFRISITKNIVYHVSSGSESPSAVCNKKSKFRLVT